MCKIVILLKKGLSDFILYTLTYRTRVLGPGHVGYVVVGASLRGKASSVRVGDTVRLMIYHITHYLCTCFLFSPIVVPSFNAM